MTYILEMLKVLALILSISGAALVAGNNKKHRLYGFVIWLISNTIWIVDSLTYHNYTQTVLWIYYNVTCFLGIRNNLDKRVPQ